MGWKSLGKKLLFPPLWLLLPLVLFSAAALILVFLKGMETTVPAYIVYAVAFYTLVAATVYCIRVLPGEYRSLRQKLQATTLGNRFFTDALFRTKVFLYLSLGVNLLYVMFHLVSWYLLRSWWFVVLSGYYVILSVLRFLLAGYVQKNRPGEHLPEEWKRARLCACILLLVNLSLSGAVLMMLYQDKGYDYPGILIYAMALYTFYSVTHTVIDMVKYRRLNSPVLSAAKLVSLSAALVSLLNLETAMFAQFGAEMSVADQRLFIILTGAGVSVTVVTLAVLFIVKATKMIRRETYGK